MANKKDEEYKLTSKDKKRIKENLMDEIKDDLTTEISKSLIDEVNKSFDEDYKDELKNKISDEISEDIKKDIKKEERKLSRSKNFKIVRLYIYILLLIALICFVVYKIYKTDNMDILGVDETFRITTNQVEETTTKVNLVDKYSYLMNKIKITDKAILEINTKTSDIARTDRILLAYNTLTTDDIDIEGSIYTVDSSKVKTAYDSLFNLNDYEGTSFEANGISYKYSTKTDSYIAISEEEPTGDDILFEVEDITEDDTYVYIDAITAIHIGNYIYSKDNLDSSISKYKVNMDLDKYSSKLSTTRFVFEKANDNYYLYAIYEN